MKNLRPKKPRNWGGTAYNGGSTVDTASWRERTQILDSRVYKYNYNVTYCNCKLQVCASAIVHDVTYPIRITAVTCPPGSIASDTDKYNPSRVSSISSTLAWPELEVYTYRGVVLVGVVLVLVGK